MSVFHQSVASNLTQYKQQQLLTMPNVSLSGYFLCNSVYAPSVYSSFCQVLRGKDTRFITVQCSIYSLKYLLMNHVYGDFLPFETFQALVEM